MIDKDFKTGPDDRDSSAALMKALYEADLRTLGKWSSDSTRRGVRRISLIVWRYAVTRLITLGRSQYMKERASRPGLPHWRGLLQYIAISKNTPGVQRDLLEVMRDEADRRGFKPHQNFVLLSCDEMIIKQGVKCVPTLVSPCVSLH